VRGQRRAPASPYPGKDPVPILQEAEWASGPVWTGAENSGNARLISINNQSSLNNIHWSFFGGISHITRMPYEAISLLFFFWETNRKWTLWI